MPERRDECRPVTLPSGETIRVRGSEPLSSEGVAALGELIDLVRAKQAAEHPADPGAEDLYARLEAAKRTYGLLSWRQFAVEIGVTPSLLSRLANGRMPGGEDLARIEAWLTRAEPADN